MNRICVLGLGYVGLPTAAMFATHGFQVLGVDVNRSIVDTINSGDVHIEEPGLKTLVQAAIKSGSLVAKAKPEPCDAFIIAVPTPMTADKQPDLSYVQAASASIIPHLRRGNLVILESTVPPNTTIGLVGPILEESGLKAGTDFFLAHSPERVLPGTVLREIVDNDRVIGGVNPASSEQARHLYKTLVSGDIYLTNATTAELVKLAENTYRDVNVALANELAQICTLLSADAWQVMELANKHPRVQFHSPGPGVGGHCLPVDPWFLVAAAPEISRLISLSRAINDAQPALVAQQVLKLLGNTSEPKVAVLGVAYKGNIDDTRGTPALAVIQNLNDAGVHLEVHDPHVRIFPIALSALERALTGADVAVLLTDHQEYRELDPAVIRSLMRNHSVLDTRNCLDQERWRQAGFHLARLGTGDVRD